jgi:indolepyruvate ferredoxin oxidoreductase alpha subunit
MQDRVSGESLRGALAEEGSDFLLAGEEGHVECLLGNEAIVRGALEAGVVFVAGYPGTPSSEVTDSFARIASARGVAFEYSVNEKVALELAFAASLAGARALCAMKHLGLMFAGDPLSTIPYVGTVGGLVIVSAADPGCHTSPNEQDQRHLGPMLHLPILMPGTPAEAHAMARSAFELSEQSRLPVLLLITTRVAHTRAVVRYGKLRNPRVAGFVRDPARLVPIPIHARKLRQEIPGKLERARAWMESQGLFRRCGSGRQAIVAAGVPAATCADLLSEAGLEERVILATLGAVHPLPEAQLVLLLREVERVLVVEELSPFLEDALCALCARHGLATHVLGKRTGHLPFEFEYEPEVIQRGLHAALNLGSPPAAAVISDGDPPPARGPGLCAGCPHRSSFFAARAVFGEEHLYFNDIGCYTLGFGPPLESADALLCMGAGFTLASGVSRVTGKRTVGFLGDSTFFHAGMPALLDAIQTDANIVAVILDNQVTAMTGFQESPGVSPEGAEPTRRISIANVARALGAQHVETVDPMDLPATIAAFERARAARGVSVIVAEHPCPVDVARRSGESAKKGTFVIDQDRCQSCGRESCGLRCEQCSSAGQMRNMARSRAVNGPRAAVAPVAPCATACPLGLCVQGYAGHIAAGEYGKALELIMSRCPLPDSVCRVCHRPCEEVCVRKDSDEAVAINDLKRFVMDWAARTGAVYDPPREPEHGRRIAVVGAGPAGLAAAHDLRLRGYGVTLFDAAAKPGGVLRSGIPGFRLPRLSLERDVQRVLDLGVSFQGGKALGRDFTLETLLADGCDAVFLAVGAGRPRKLELQAQPGAGAPRVVDALAYLAAPAAGRAVVVIGGGNAAFDAARTALRRGAARVVLAYRRGRADMPALPDEIEAAEREGVLIRTRIAPLALVRAPVPGLLCVTSAPGAPDASARGEELLEADLVLSAVGQEADLGADLGLELDPRGGLRVDPLNARTSHPRVFAGGDAVPGPRTVTDAIAWGQRAAWGIDQSLRGAELADKLTAPPRPVAWPLAREKARAPLLRSFQGLGRARPPELEIRERAACFDEVVGTLSEAAARAEAARCAVCGSCGNCRSCLDLFGCPAFFLRDGRIEIEPGLCIGCGVCADFCPNAAIIRVEVP